MSSMWDDTDTDQKGQLMKGIRERVSVFLIEKTTIPNSGHVQRFLYSFCPWFSKCTQNYFSFYTAILRTVEFPFVH